MVYKFSCNLKYFHARLIILIADSVTHTILIVEVIICIPRARKRKTFVRKRFNRWIVLTVPGFYISQLVASLWCRKERDSCFSSFLLHAQYTSRAFVAINSGVASKPDGKHPFRYKPERKLSRDFIKMYFWMTFDASYSSISCFDSKIIISLLFPFHVFFNQRQVRSVAASRSYSIFRNRNFSSLQLQH